MLGKIKELKIKGIYGNFKHSRLYPNKNFGRIVDYFGVFDDAAKALQFDEKSIQKVITNLKVLIIIY